MDEQQPIRQAQDNQPQEQPPEPREEQVPAPASSTNRKLFTGIVIIFGLLVIGMIGAYLIFPLSLPAPGGGMGLQPATDDESESLTSTSNAIDEGIDSGATLDNLAITSDLAELPNCFNISSFETQIDTSDWNSFSGHGFAVKYPMDEVVIERTSELYEPKGSGFPADMVTYSIKLKADENHKATISVNKVDRKLYRARYLHSGPVTYELYSNTWWKGINRGNLWDAVAIKRCNPNSVASAESGKHFIYVYGDGDVGAGFRAYVVVMRETPGTDNYDPLVIEFRTTHVGDGYNISYYEMEDRLKDIVESLVKTIELRPTSKG